MRYSTLLQGMPQTRASVIILCCILVHVNVIGSNTLLYHTIRAEGTMSYLVSQAVAYLLYPLLGWLADVYFTRYKFVKYSFILMITGTLLMTLCGALALKFQKADHVAIYFLVIGGLSLIICLTGLGLFESTAIQFGMDQLLEEPSDQLSSFIHWYYWSSYLGRLVLTTAVLGIMALYSRCIVVADANNIMQEFHPHEVAIAIISVLSMAVLQLLTASIGLCHLIYSKRDLNIDRTGENPLKLIYMVLRYAWNHTCPENRSAFTYWEEDIPSRIDLGKSKYGGPFTTEEVEDAKTFLSILLLLLPLLGFQLSGYGYSVEDQLLRRYCPSFWVLVLVGDPMFITILTVVIGIPMYQWIFVRYFQRYTPNMLKRMGLGLLCCLVKQIIEIVIQMTATDQECYRKEGVTFISCYFLRSEIYMHVNGTYTSVTTYDYSNCSERNSPFLWLLVTSVLHGLSFVLVFMTTLEFICAQAPLRLKGLLIGLWYCSLAVSYLVVGVTEIYTIGSTTWEIFQEVKTFLMFLSFMLYLCVSKRYHYRQRDEVVNEQFLVEEIYERELDLAEEYESDCSDESQEVCTSEMLPLLHSGGDVPGFYGATS